MDGTVKQWRLFLLICAALFAGALPANAQTHNKFALGGNFTSRLASDSDLHHVKGRGVMWRIGHDKEGWGWHWGLNWFSTNIDRPIGGSTVDLGELRIRPFMSGYGYTHVVGRTAITADVLGGYAINSIKLSPAAADAFRDRLGALSLSGDARNTVVAKPEIGVWYDVSRKVGITVNVGYMIARPRIMVRSSMGNDERRVNADVLGMTIGAVYSIF